MVTVKSVDTRRRDDGFLETEARVEAADTDTIAASDLDLSAISYVNVSIAQSGSGVSTSNPMVLTQASLDTTNNQITVGIASFSGGTFGSLVEAAGSAVLNVIARGSE